MCAPCYDVLLVVCLCLNKGCLPSDPDKSLCLPSVVINNICRVFGLDHTFVTSALIIFSFIYLILANLVLWEYVKLFRSDLISAMKLPDTHQLEPSSYVEIKEAWRSEWEIGVQVREGCLNHCYNAIGRRFHFLLAFTMCMLHLRASLCVSACILGKISQRRSSYFGLFKLISP